MESAREEAVKDSCLDLAVVLLTAAVGCVGRQAGKQWRDTLHKLAVCGLITLLSGKIAPISLPF